MRSAVAEPASPTVAMAISGTTRYADVNDLPLWQTTHSGQSERISMRSPNGTSPMAHGMTPWPWAHGVSIRKGNVFSSQFWLGLGVSELQNCGLCHLPFWELIPRRRPRPSRISRLITQERSEPNHDEPSGGAPSSGVPGKSPQYSDDNPWLSPRLHGRNRLACAWPVGVDFWHRPWPRPLRCTCPFSSAFVKYP